MGKAAQTSFPNRGKYSWEDERTDWDTVSGAASPNLTWRRQLFDEVPAPAGVFLIKCQQLKTFFGLGREI